MKYIKYTEYTKVIKIISYFSIVLNILKNFKIFGWILTIDFSVLGLNSYNWKIHSHSGNFLRIYLDGYLRSIDQIHLCV